MKKIATRLIIWDSSTKSAIAVHPTGRKFKSKEGGAAIGVFNIPGGEIDPGEDMYECVIREIKEECNLDIKKSELQYLGFYDYSAVKDLHFFFCEKDVNLSTLKCESYFESPSGKMLPEVNGYSKFNFESEIHMFFPVLQKVLKKVISDHKELFN